MTSNAAIIELMKRDVLQDGEEVVRVKHWHDGLALTTNLRHFVAGSERANWSVGNEQWVDDVVIATRDDLLVQGQPEQFGFLLLADGVEVYLNDQDAVAELGRRLAEDMEPTGYAQILVAFHPYSSAARAVLTEPDGLRRAFSQPDLPDVEPIRLSNSVDGLTLTFASSVSYTRPGEAPLLDVLAWTVDVPAGERARWNSQKTLTGIRLDPGDGAQRQQD